MPEKLNWTAANRGEDRMQDARAVLLSLWDGQDKSALRIDLWTKEMMVDEMADFFYQTFMGMADTYERSTHQAELVQDIRTFAQGFYEKFRAIQLKENSLQKNS